MFHIITCLLNTLLLIIIYTACNHLHQAELVIHFASFEALHILHT